MEICIYCQEREGVERDHVIPQSFGGVNFTVPACRKCNTKIGNRIFSTFEERRACALGEKYSPSKGWTDERRQAASDRAKEHWARGRTLVKPVGQP